MSESDARVRVRHAKITRVLAARLKQARKAAGMSRVEAAEASGVSHSTIERIEQAVGPGTIQTLGMLCRCYGVSMDWAAGNIDQPSPE